MRMWNLRTVAAVVAVALVGNSVAMAASKPLDPVKVKVTLMKQGIGMGVKLTEVDGTHVTGVLTAVHDSNFEVTPQGTLEPTVISYGQIMAMHVGKSTLAKVGKGIGIAAVVYVAVVVVAFIAIIGVEAR